MDKNYSPRNKLAILPQTKLSLSFSAVDTFLKKMNQYHSVDKFPVKLLLYVISFCIRLSAKTATHYNH